MFCSVREVKLYGSQFFQLGSRNHPEPLCSLIDVCLRTAELAGPLLLVVLKNEV